MNSEDMHVTVEVAGGPRSIVSWRPGMTIRDALESAFDTQGAGARLTYALQYYGAKLGHLVMMINENYDSFNTSYEPDFFWYMAINGTPADEGVDRAILNAGDIVSFAYLMRTQDADNRLARAKHEIRSDRGG